MSTNTRVAVVLVTHNSARFLEETLASIDEQCDQPDVRIAVDDCSDDGSVEMLRRCDFDVQVATTSATDAKTRIGQNFVQGLRMAQRGGAEFVVLGDHDDLWRRDRIRRQVKILKNRPIAAMLASDGFLIDTYGAAVPGTIRSRFPLPDDFNDRPRAYQLNFALRHSIATGGASALRLSALPHWSVPAGWLHDRWWSLAAVRVGAFVADPTVVIDYRISLDQEIGLDTAGQEKQFRWLGSKARSLGSTAQRARDVSRLARW